MLQSLSFTSSLSSTLVLETNDQIHSPRCSPKGGFNSTICCSSSSRNHAYIPKLEPFSRTKFERLAKDPPLIEKSENQLADYCSTLEGERSYSCWKAYFELKELEKEAPKEEVERLIIEAGGVKSLIGCLHGIADLYGIAKKETKTSEEKAASTSELKGLRDCPIPDGLPKSREELEEEEKARMPDSPFTRLLRAKGTHPAWYSPAPEY
ncbi:OLC1v1003056C1 [Oldenlandia corymbosa var. corymbosa]|uniref:OLC1v1003056C1 n=1 Tax=Oldenlandia corymbosa var. corymbosa TaxID=529605 RepID=A0AAV1DBJ1_OLDCO|nr:OLC1v1003056C1 [Oldenlandia corymbosa var. corymbosa]